MPINACWKSSCWQSRKTFEGPFNNLDTFLSGTTSTRRLLALRIRGLGRCQMAADCLSKWFSTIFPCSSKFKNNVSQLIAHIKTEWDPKYLELFLKCLKTFVL